MITTPIRAKKDALALWSFLAETGKHKTDYPNFSYIYSTYPCSGPMCGVYRGRFFKVDCDGCPLGHCRAGDLYGQLLNADPHSPLRKKFASVILERITNWNPKKSIWDIIQKETEI